ncbi:hypothetical protein RI367_002390 [Sorochytrium milnesiophthora]
MFSCLTRNGKHMSAPSAQTLGTSSQERQALLDKTMDVRSARLAFTKPTSALSNAVERVAFTLPKDCPSAELLPGGQYATALADIAGSLSNPVELKQAQILQLATYSAIRHFARPSPGTEGELVTNMQNLTASTLSNWSIFREYRCTESAYKRNHGQMDVFMRNPNNKTIGAIIYEAKRAASVKNRRIATMQLMCYAMYQSVQQHLAQTQWTIFSTQCGHELATYIVESAGLLELKLQSFDLARDPERPIPFYNLCLTGNVWNLARAHDLLLLSATILRLQDDSGVVLVY